MTYTEYCQRYNRPMDNNFALACYEQNSREELVQAVLDYLDHGANETDCTTWGISEEEWSGAVDTALMMIVDDKKIEQGLL